MDDLITKLLQPASAERPCGPDLSYDPRMDELESSLKGKPEVEIGNVLRPAEPPDWRELTKLSTEFLAHSKHLRVAMIFCCSLLRTTGIAGFRDGVQLLRGLLEQYWPTLYPELDPEDNNDPTQRLNILGALTARQGTVTGWLRVIDYLYAVPLCRPKGAPPISLELIQEARLKAAAPTEGSGQTELSKLEAQMRAVGADQFLLIQGPLRDAQEAINGIDQFLTATLGAENTISFDALQKTLQEMLAAVEPYVSGGVPAASAALSATADNIAQGSRSGAITIHGEIRSREDVARAIESICNYYQQVEPSSPVPYLLRRAQKLAMMNFVQAVQELNLASVESLRPSMGSIVEGSAGGGEAPPAQ